MYVRGIFFLYPSSFIIIDSSYRSYRGAWSISFYHLFIALGVPLKITTFLNFNY